MPLSWFDDRVNKFGFLASGSMSDLVFQNIFDAIYFSGVTITTLGYGDFSPYASVPKLLVVLQVLSGFTLIVVSFAVYAGVGKSTTHKET